MCVADAQDSLGCSQYLGVLLSMHFPAANTPCDSLMLLISDASAHVSEVLSSKLTGFVTDKMLEAAKQWFMSTFGMHWRSPDVS